MTATLEAIAALAEAARVKPAQQPEQSKWSTADLLTAQFPEPKWAIPELVPAGLVVLAGRPKMGKSWLALQMAVAIGSGGKVLDRSVEAGRVFYLALEDSKRRVQSRLLKQQATTSTNVDFQFVLDKPLSMPDSVGKLIDEITANQYRLVVIDTISRALGRVDQTNQSDMNIVFGLLQQAAIKTNTAILLVDHHRKSAGGEGGGDVVDDVMAATSKTAVADAVLGLYRKRGDKAATLKLAGRDVMELELAVTFDKDMCCWQFVGHADEVRADEVQGQILEAIRNAGGQATASQLMRLLGKQLPNILRELAELENKNLVLRGAKQGREVPWKLTG